jgi:threonine dehydrogenase-like Zn-dependent dehydrogenase
VAVIIGPGAHGLGCVVAAGEGRAAHVFAVGRTAGARLEAARALGAVPIESSRQDVIAAVREATGGRMADVVVDLAPGAPETVQMAVALARKGGTVVLASAKHGQPVSGFDGDAIVRNEITVRGVRGRDYRSVEEALQVIRAGRHPLQRLRTHTFPLAEADRALRVLGERTDPAAIHVAVVP